MPRMAFASWASSGVIGSYGCWLGGLLGFQGLLPGGPRRFLALIARLALGRASMKRHCSGAASADGKPDIASAIEMQAASFM